MEMTVLFITEFLVVIKEVLGIGTHSFIHQETVKGARVPDEDLIQAAFPRWGEK